LLVGILRRLQLQRLGLLDQRAHPVGLPAFLDMLGDEADHVVAPAVGDQPRLDRRPAGRQLVEHGDVEVGVVAHGQGARNRRRRHHQLVRIAALLAQREALGDAEAVLFIDNGQPELGEIDAFLDQRVGADDQLRLGGRGRQLFALGLPSSGCRTARPPDAERFQPVAQFQVVLLGKNFGRRHEGRLPAGRNRLAGSERGDDGLAGTDIALQQALHRIGLGQIAGNFCHRPQLGAGQAERQAASSRRSRRDRPAQPAPARPARGAPDRRGAGQLLGQHLVELNPPPGRVIAGMQGLEIGARRRPVQEVQAARQAGQFQALAQFVGQVSDRSPSSSARPISFCSAELAVLRSTDKSGSIPPAAARRRRPCESAGAPSRRRRIRRAPRRKARTRDPFAERRLLVGIEAEETQRQLSALIERTHHHLPAWPELYFAGLTTTSTCTGSPHAARSTGVMRVSSS
jgi:hypothetical protein